MRNQDRRPYLIKSLIEFNRLLREEIGSYAFTDSVEQVGLQEALDRAFQRVDDRLVDALVTEKGF